MDTKNARSNYGEPSRLIQMVDIAKMGILFESANFCRKFFRNGFLTLCCTDPFTSGAQFNAQLGKYLLDLLRGYIAFAGALILFFHFLLRIKMKQYVVG